MELLSVSMLIVISNFCLRFLFIATEKFSRLWTWMKRGVFFKWHKEKHYRISSFVQVEPWMLGIYFVTQNSDDLLDERLKNNIGLKFAFRSTDIHEIKKTLEFWIGSRGWKVIKTSARFGKRPMLDARFVWSGRCGPGSPSLWRTLPCLWYSSACSRENGVRRWKRNFSDCRNRFISIINLTVVLSLVGTIAVATSLVDDTVEAGNLYSQYSLEQLSTRFLCG